MFNRQCWTAFAGLFVCRGFFGILLYQAYTGRISLEGLLRSKGPRHCSERPFSPARLQLLLFTVTVAATYLHRVLSNLDRPALPGLPTEGVAALGGSQAGNLVGKAF